MCLVARAFGAEGIYISGIKDSNILSTVKKACETWGGDFWVDFVVDPINLVRIWKSKGGSVVHLTMYGIPLREVLANIMKESKDLLVIVGGEKVPTEYYKEADYNIAVGNQPHSEVSALAIFLDRINNGAWESLIFSGAKLRIIPSKRGKFVQQIK